MSALLRIAKRVILSVSVLALFAGLSQAQGIEGEWDVKYGVGEEIVTAKMVIVRSPNGLLSANWTGEDGVSVLSGLRYEDRQLTFVRRWVTEGETVEVAFEGSIDGTTLTGGFITDYGEIPFRATREATVEELMGSHYISPLAGEWDVTSDSQLGVLKRQLVIKANLSGTYEGDQSKRPLRDVKLEGDQVTFSVTVDVQGQELPMDFVGKLEGKQIVGTYSVAELGPVSEVTAVKVKALRTTRLVLITELGEIELELQMDAAGVTAANFLSYARGGYFNGGSFHRAVRLDNQAREDVLIEVIQASINPDLDRPGYPPIILQRTTRTGLKHVDGAISMARGREANSARSSFFICINDQPSLDFGGARNADGQGFAVFGGVLRGMDVVRQIQQSETDGEALTTPVKIIAVRTID